MPEAPTANPLLLPLLALSTGILLSRAARFETPELAIALALLLSLTFLSRRYCRRIQYPIALIAICCTGIWVDVLHRLPHTPEIDASSQESVILTGCVIDPPIYYQDRDQFTIDLANRAGARVSLALKEGEAPLNLTYGQLVEFEGKVRPIRNFHNPGSFDFVGYSARRQIYWTAAVSSGTPVKVLPGRCGTRFWAAIFALRTATLNRIEALYPNNPYAIGMMQAILLGQSTKLEKIWTDHFRRTGTFHTLVISGMHISVLAGSVLFLLRLCFMGEIQALFLTALATWIYALVTGWSAPAVRAAGGFTLYLACRYFYRRGRLLNLLAAVAIGYLVYDPGQLFESSFQLSFLSVAAIGVLAVPLMQASSTPFSRALDNITDSKADLHVPPAAAQMRLELRLLAETFTSWVPISQAWLLATFAWLTRLALYIYDMVIISTVIQVGLALPMALYFHRFSFTGLSANVLIVPLLSFVVPVGFLAVFTGWHWVAALAEVCLRLSERIAEWHARFEPDARVLEPPVWLAVAFVMSLLLLCFVMARPLRWRLASFAVVLALFAVIFIHPFPPRVVRGQLEVSAIDVGQGDGLLVAFPDGKLMMIDGGGFPNFYGRKNKPKMDIGEDVISPYLWSRSIRKLDVIVCTHAHEDHAGGLGALIENFHPDQLWTGANGESPVWIDLRAKAIARHVKIDSMKAGRVFDYGGTHIEVLAPLADYQPLDEGKNNDSLVFRMTFGRNSFLFSGDMEKQVEAELWADGKLTHSDVLKVPHHGSKTSSSELLLGAVTPEFAIISDGFENSFHHPHKDVLARLAEHHASIVRTDQLGLITIRSDGRRLTYQTAVTE